MCGNEHRKSTIVETSRLNETDLVDYSQTVRANLPGILDMLAERARRTCSQIREKYSPKNVNYVIRNMFDYLAQTLLVRVESLSEELERAERRVRRRIDRYARARRGEHARALDDVKKKFQILCEASTSTTTTNTSRNDDMMMRRVDALRACEDMFVCVVNNLNEERTTSRRYDEIEEATRKDKSEFQLSSEIGLNSLQRCHIHRMRAISKVLLIFKSILIFNFIKIK